MKAHFKMLHAVLLWVDVGERIRNLTSQSAQHFAVKRQLLSARAGLVIAVVGKRQE